MHLNTHVLLAGNTEHSGAFQTFEELIGFVIIYLYITAE